MIYNNMTTIENYTGTEVNCPCVTRTLDKDDQIEVSRNIYDRLWLNNFTDVFGTNIWTWPIPVKHEMEGAGFYYPKIPEFEMSDLQSIVESKHVEQTFEMHEGKESAVRYAKTALIKYKGQSFLVEDQIHTISEDDPNIPTGIQVDENDDSD